MAEQLTAKQQEMVDYLRSHGPTSAKDLARALDSTLRGIGIRYSAMLWMDGPCPVACERPNSGADSYIYSARALGD